MSGVAGPRITTKVPFFKWSTYPYGNSAPKIVTKDQLIWPPGMEKWKGFFGQRKYTP